MAMMYILIKGYFARGGLGEGGGDKEKRSKNKGSGPPPPWVFEAAMVPHTIFVIIYAGLLCFA